MAKLKIGSPNRGATLDSTSITPDLSHYIRNDGPLTAGVKDYSNHIYGDNLFLSNKPSAANGFSFNTSTMSLFGENVAGDTFTISPISFAFNTRGGKNLSGNVTDLVSTLTFGRTNPFSINARDGYTEFKVGTNHNNLLRLTTNSLIGFGEDGTVVYRDTLDLDDGQIYAERQNNNLYTRATLNSWDFSKSSAALNLYKSENETTVEGNLFLDTDGSFKADKVVKAVTPTDATDKSQLVTIEYLESVLQNYQHV